MSQSRNESSAASDPGKPVPVEALLDEDDFAILREEAGCMKSSCNDQPAKERAWGDRYEYDRILDLVQRIEDCQREIEKQLPEGNVGGVRALGLASQIVADAQELRSLLQARNEAMSRVSTHKVVIDADDEAHARWLEQALTNDGYRVHRERRHLVHDAEGNMTQEVERVG